MAYTPQQIVKAQKLSSAYVPLVQEKLVLPNFFVKKTMDDFKGALDDTISIKVPGVLAAREYAFRNDRSEPIQYDQFVERKIDLKVGGNAYSATRLTDEQKDFDELSWADIVPMQSDAVAEYLNHAAVAALEARTPAAVLSAVEGQGTMRKAIFGARSILNAFQTGGSMRTLVVGSNFELAMQLDEKLTLADAVGDAIAGPAVKEATIGRVAGFNVVVDQSIDPDVAYAFSDNAMMFFNAAPSVPQSAPYGKTTSYGGLSLRHIVDYDMDYFMDRSAVNCWYGFAPVTDVYRYWDSASKTSKIGQEEHWTRLVKIELNGTAAFNGTAELTTATRVDLARVQAASSTAPATTP